MDDANLLQQIRDKILGVTTNISSDLDNAVYLQQIRDAILGVTQDNSKYGNLDEAIYLQQIRDAILGVTIDNSKYGSLDNAIYLQQIRDAYNGITARVGGGMDDDIYLVEILGVAVAPGGGVLPETWWLASGTNLVPYMKHKSSDFVNDAALTAPAGGRTYLLTTLTRAILQNGLIRHVRVWVLATGTSAWKAKVFRKNGANYDLVSECAFTPAATGLLTLDLVTPMACQPGDRIGLFVPENGQLSVDNTAAANTYNEVDGDVTTSNAFTTSTASKSLNYVPYGYQPFAVFTGDSIMEGHNTPVVWNGPYDTTNGVGGNATAQIENQMRAIMTGFEFQNWSQGSQTYSWVNTTAFLNVFTTFALKATAWIIMAGVNDVSTGRLWADVESDLNAIDTRQTTGTLWICEILPWTGGNDIQAATIRTFNANLATWCAAHSAQLILCHDVMGQVRVSTGQLDDLKTAYNQDGVHLTQAGVDALAAIIKAALRVFYNI